MAIKMNPAEFPEHRRHDPKRAAEGRVFDALQALNLDGHGLYEFRYRKAGKQVDHPLWLHDKGRLAVQVKGGQYEMDDTGQWFLRAHDGRLERVHSSPLEETADGCMEMRNGIFEATRFKNFVAGLLIFPDMRRKEEMERVALGKHCVFIVWGLDNLQEDLERIVKEAKFRRPPQSRISENEWTCLHELQYRGAQGLREGDRTMRDNGQGPVEGWEAERQFTFGSATITIQHLDTLIVQQCPLHRDTDDGPLMPVA